MDGYTMQRQRLTEEKQTAKGTLFHLTSALQAARLEENEDDIAWFQIKRIEMRDHLLDLNRALEEISELSSWGS